MEKTTPQGRHRDAAPQHRTWEHQRCHWPFPAISPRKRSEYHQPRPWYQRVGILDSSACSPLLQGRALAPSFTRRAQRRAPHGTQWGTSTAPAAGRATRSQRPRTLQPLPYPWALPSGLQST